MEPRLNLRTKFKWRFSGQDAGRKFGYTEHSFRRQRPSSRAAFNARIIVETRGCRCRSRWPKTNPLRRRIDMRLQARSSFRLAQLEASMDFRQSRLCLLRCKQE